MGEGVGAFGAAEEGGVAGLGGGDVDVDVGGGDAGGAEEGAEGGGEGHFCCCGGDDGGCLGEGCAWGSLG